jgi:hypothetical protein
VAYFAIILPALLIYYVLYSYINYINVLEMSLRMFTSQKLFLVFYGDAYNKSL